MKKELILIVESMLELNRLINVVKKVHDYLATFFGVLIEIITQLFFFIVAVIPYVVILGILLVIIWRLINYIWQLFDSLETTVSQADPVGERVVVKVAEKQVEKLKQETEILRQKIRQLTAGNNYYQAQLMESQQIVEQLNREKNSYKNSLKEQTPVLELTKRMVDLPLKKELKQKVRQVITAVDQLEAADIYQRAIDNFRQELTLLQIRYALPYKVILHLFELYNEAEQQQFYQSFQLFMQLMSMRKYRKIYRSAYYSPKQKMTLFMECGVLEKLDKEFSDFLYFLLKNYNYRQVRELYQHFQKVWSLKYYQGVVTVSLASEIEVAVFRQLWEQTDSHQPIEFIITTEVKKGVIIQSGPITVDLSYQRLIDHYIDHQEMEVSL